MYEPEPKRRRMCTAVTAKPWEDDAVTHYRWNCPHQRTHWKSNGNVCEHCICYVCQVSLKVCSVHAHRFAAPAEVAQWELDRSLVDELPTQKFQAASPCQGRVKLFTLKLPFTLNEDVRAFMISQVGVPQNVIIKYLEQWAPLDVWPLLKDIFFMHANSQEAYRWIGVMQSITSLQAMKPKDARQMIGKMQWPAQIGPAHFSGTMRAVCTDAPCMRVLPPCVRGRSYEVVIDVFAGKESHYRHWSSAAFDCIVSEPIVMPPDPGPARNMLGLEAHLARANRPLFEHQRQSVDEMVQIETRGLTARLWRRIAAFTKTPFFVNTVFNSIHVGGDAPDSLCYGGLLTNDRGTGKTMTAAALIATHGANDEWLQDSSVQLILDGDEAPAAVPRDVSELIETMSPQDSDDEDAGNVGDSGGLGRQWSHPMPISDCDRRLREWHAMEVHRVRATLVVVPGANLLQQWYDELQRLGLRTVTYYGRSKVVEIGELDAVDVVLTTSSTLRSTLTSDAGDIRQICDANSIFAKVRWWRVVVDEIHKLLTTSSLNKSGLAVLWLRARSRWGLTATPGKALGQCRLYALMLFGIPTRHSAERSHMHHFLRYPTQYVQTPALRNAYTSIIYPAMTVRVALGEIMLPTTVFNHVSIEPEAEWVEQYKETIEQCRRIVRQCSGPKINLMLNRILMAVSGMRPFARPTVDEYGAQNLEGAPEVPPDIFDCAICLQPLNRPVKTQCDHFFCSGCIGHWTAQNYNCPMCRTTLAQSLTPCTLSNDSLASGPVVLAPTMIKFNRICADIVSTVTEDTSRSAEEHERLPNRLLCFSRFPDMRVAISEALSPIVSCTTSVQEFQSDSTISVLILSIQSCGVGLNLMEANHVVLCEPSFKFSNDEQAYGRAARIGQKRVVRVHRYVTRDTVEQNVFEESRDVSNPNVNMRRVFEVD